MKYQLETIPIWEAYEARTECPICSLTRKIEKSNIDFFLGGSVMEPDIRARVNALGFCREHFVLLFESGNKQGVALMAHTHLRELQRSLVKFENRLGESELRAKGISLVPKKRGASKPIAEYIRFIENSTRSCVFCEKTATAIARYTFTIVYLWKKNAEFREVFAASNGFCVPHRARIAGMADEVLSKTHRNKFILGLFELERKNLERVEAELLWYTQKFDHKNSDKPWYNSADALLRTIQKLTGHSFKA